MAIGTIRALPLSYLEVVGGEVARGEVASDDGHERRDTGPPEGRRAPGRALPRSWSGPSSHLAGALTLVPQRPDPGHGPRPREPQRAPGGDPGRRAKPRRFGLRRRERGAVGHPAVDLANGDDSWLASDDDLAPIVSITHTEGDLELWSGLAEDLEVRELQQRLRDKAERQRARLELAARASGVAPVETREPARDLERERASILDLAPSGAHLDGVRLEQEFWADGGAVSGPGLFSRRRRKRAPGATSDGDATEVVDLSPYEVAPGRRGAFRDAVAETRERQRGSERSWARARAERDAAATR